MATKKRKINGPATYKCYIRLGKNGKNAAIDIFNLDVAAGVWYEFRLTPVKTIGWFKDKRKSV